jgi:hypothetical protein
MEKELSDKTLPEDTIYEMEERRVESLIEAGIEEDDILERSGKHMNTWNSYFNENIVRGKDDMNFVLRDQWTAVERSEFSRLFKPAMTFNKLYDPIKKIVGEQRKNKPDLLVRSLTGKAKQDQIDMRADLVRTISYQSQSDLVYQSAFKSALLMGFGAFQIILDYETPKSFNRTIRLEMIPDPIRCSWDPTALKPHKGDGNFCSRNYVFTRDQFFATYPYISDPVSYIDPYMLLDFQWQTRDTIIVNDYFEKEWYPLIVYKLSNGMGVTEDEWEHMEKAFAKQMEIVGDANVREILRKEKPQIVSQRQTQDYQIMHYRMIRNQIIEFSEWPSKQLPIPFVDGDSYYIEGRQYTKSFIHEARDAQKCTNYLGSEIIADVKNRRREQWIATPDNIIGYEQQWRNPETQLGVMMAKPDPKTGAMPAKQAPWDLSPALMANFQRSGQDIREILGFSENEALQGRDMSGKARRERKLEGSMSAYVYFDNLNQAIAQGGRIILDLLPYVIGEDERHMVVTKSDDKTQSMIFNQKNQQTGELDNKLEPGEYDIEIDSGPSFAVQRETSLEYFQQMVGVNPQVFNLIADLWAGNLDIEQVAKVKERLTNLVPPEIIAKEEGKQLPPKPPNPQEMMLKQEMELKQAMVQEKQGELKIKEEKLKIEQEKNQLAQVELMLKAQKAQQDATLDVYNHVSEIERTKIAHGLDHRKHDLDFSHKISSLLTDIYKHDHPHEKKSEK